jgi:Tfp pilus assembly protein PilX
MRKYVFSPINNQNGAALILVLTMLAVLMILCVFALDNSTLEVKIANNDRAAKQALYAAERGVRYALDNLSDCPNLNEDKAPSGNTYAEDIRIDRSALLDSDDLKEGEKNGAQILTTGPPPTGSGMDATTAGGFEALYYTVEAHGVFPEDAPNPSRTGVEMQVGRIVSK